MGKYKKNSITLVGAVGLGTGVMISAGIFALLGQVAELSGQWFPLIFIIGSIVTGFSSYSYIKMSQEFPSAGGIGMFLVKAYGKGTIATAASLMMAISMIINQSLVARTFGTYTLQLFEGKQPSWLIPLLGVGLIVFSFVVNISGNTFIQSFTSIASFVKILGLSVLALSGLWIVDFALPSQSSAVNQDAGTLNLIAAVSLTILAFKGFTTITNSGAEITKPRKNIGLAISISIMISLVIYLLLSWAVSSNLSIDEIIKAKDYALAEAARPAFGDYGVWLTVILAIIATITGIIASVFAVSRMLAMLSEMSLIPKAYFGIKQSVQKNTLVLTVVLAIILTVTLDLTRIASMGAILYLIMDMIVHLGVLKHLRHKVGANPIIVTIALVLDGVILSAFIWVKIKSDLFVVVVSGIIVTLLFVVEKVYLNRKSK
ncbi:APC family permease [Metabacillus endolithicus]|uniref:APC family permease n=1 Tax=Metabacillus endolithicus TaxID=1535204 RepID=A0ABW5BR07_9BACI|nr:APC family permease [Metabacillus endolithicus]UPG63500.1 APC family permease [Metabacillus endolithicus]